MCDLNKNSKFNQINHKNKSFNRFITKEWQLSDIFQIFYCFYIQGVPYHKDKPWTGDRSVYDGPEPKKIFF